MASIKFNYRKVSIVFVSLLVAILLSYVYIFRIVPAKEQELNTRGFRILSRMERNIHEKKLNVLRTIDQVYSKNYNYVVSTNMAMPKGFYFKGLDLSDIITEAAWKSDYNNSQFYPHYDDYENKWAIRFFGDSYSLAKTSSKASQKWDFKLNTNDVMVYDYDAETFFNDILNYRDDFFEDYLVLHKDVVIYQSRPLVYKTKDPSEVDVSSKNASKVKVLYTDYVLRDTLSGNEYYVYYHPFNKSSDINFTICGLVPVTKYIKAKYLLSVNEIVWLSLFLLLIACALPFIKIFAVSRFEQILHTDVLMLGVASIIGASIFSAMLILKSNSIAENKREENFLRNLSVEIREKMMSEIKGTLKEIESARKNMQHADFQGWVKSNQQLPYAPDPTLLNKYFNTDSSKHYAESLLLIDSEGRNWAAWLQHGIDHPDMDLSKRDYVSAITKHQPQRYKVFLDSTNNETKRALASEYFMQPIYSWQSQENTVVFSQPASIALHGVRGLDILALETRLFSVMKTALPPEASYAVVDSKSNVLFHSDGKRNLRESFFEECGQSPLFKEYIESRIDTVTKLNYYGRKHLARFDAFKELPFTLITLYDTTANMSSLANEVTFTVLLLALLWLIILAILYMTYLFTKRPTLLRRQKLNLNWLRVNPDNEATFKVLNITLLIPTLLTFFVPKTSSLLFISFILPVIALGICGVVLFYGNGSRYTKMLYENYFRFQYRVFFSLCLVVVIGLSALLYFSSEQILSLNSVVGALAILFFVVVVYNPACANPLLRTLRSWFDDPKVIKWAETYLGWLRKNWSFAASAFILLIYNLSIFPTINVFTFAIQQERQIISKRTGLEIARDFEKRMDWITENFVEYFSNLTEQQQCDLLKLGTYTASGIDSLECGNSIEIKKLLDESEAQRSVMCANENRLQNLYVNFVNLPKINWSEYDLKGTLSAKQISSDTTNLWWWDEIEGKLNYVLPQKQSDQKIAGISINIPSFASAWSSLTFLERIALVTLVLFSLGIAYKILLMIHTKLMLTQYFNGDNLATERKADKEFLVENITSVGGNLMVISLPGTSALRFLESEIKSLGYTLSDEDTGLVLVSIKHYNYVPPDKTSASKKIMILPFFDLKANNIEQCQKQMDALTSFFQDSTTKVIWIASADPCEQVGIIAKRYIDQYQRAIRSNDGTFDFNAHLTQMDKLLHVLDDFQKINFPLEENQPSTQTRNGQATMPKYAEDEFKFGIYFAELRSAIEQNGLINAYFDGEKTRRDQSEEFFILKIQDICQNYYYAIWASLSTKEKYVLYDLAQDEVTNYKNFGVLTELERKGILFIDNEDNALKIFNKSFRNFILTVVNPDDALILEKEINIKGTWKTISSVMWVFFVVMGSYLFLTEQTAFNQIVGFTTAITSLLPIVFKFFNPAKTAKEP